MDIFLHLYLKKEEYSVGIMDGKTVFITGGAGGIGNATARAMLREGAHAVMITDLNEELTLPALAKLKEDFPGRNIEGTWPNLLDEEEVGSTLRDFAQRYGKLDAVCSIAGISQGNVTIKRMKPGEFQRLMDVNLMATYNVDRQAGLIMTQQRFGSIVNTSSITGLYGSQMGCGYGTSKAAVIGLTKSLGRELGFFNVRVNCIAPGIIRTNMTAILSEPELKAATAGIALRRMGEPEEVANMFLFLASDLSSYCTAAVYQVDGFVT